MKKLALLLPIALIIFSCGKHTTSSSSTATTPATTPVVATMSPEESVFRTVCSKCHGLGKADPSRHTVDEWVKIVDDMQRKKGGNQFTDDEKTQILIYINARAKK
jgi:hypothetical protein